MTAEGPRRTSISSWSGAVIALLAAVFAMALVPAAASAAPQGPWQVPATDLSAPAEEAIASTVRIGPDGSAIAVWQIDDGATNVIQAATRPPGGSFGTPFNLSEPTENAVNPNVAIGSDGSAAVTWLRVDTTNLIVRAMTRPPGGSFGEPVDLSEAGQDAFGPRIGVGPDGTITAVWSRNSIIQASTRLPGSSFGAPVDISETGADTGEEIAIGPDGAATVVWERAGIIQASTRAPGGSFGTPEDLSESGQSAIGPSIAIGSDKTTIVSWRRGGCDSGPSCVIQSATRPPEGAFGTPENLSDAGQRSRGQQIVIEPDGAATAVWQLFDGSWWVVQTADRPPGGPFGAPVDLTEIGNYSTGPRIAIGPDGTTTVVYQLSTPGDPPPFSPGVIQSVTRPPGGSFGAAADLSASGQDAAGPTIAIGPDGTATSVWSRTDGTNEVIQTASTAAPLYALGVERSGSGQGTVTSSPGGIDCADKCVEVFSSLTEVTLTAAADAVSNFAGWSGPCSGTGSCVVTMDQARSVSATFELQQRALTVTKNGNGTGSVTSAPAGIDCGPRCSSDFGYGTGVTLTATAPAGSTFAGWSGACSGTGSCVVTMDQARSVSATFALQKSPLAVAKLSKVKVTGPAKVKRGKKATYKVKITNSGNKTATGVRLKVNGRGVSFNTSVGQIGAKKTKTVKIRLKAKKPGKVKVSFKVTSTNAGGRTVKKTITVRK